MNPPRARSPAVFGELRVETGLLYSFFSAVQIVGLPMRGQEKKTAAGIDWGSIVIHFVGRK
jgi:hypothetical protein